MFNSLKKNKLEIKSQKSQTNTMLRMSNHS